MALPAALGRLGLLDAVLACGEPIARVDGRTVGGRKVLDLPYGELSPGPHGLGVHRGALFTVLHDALREAEIPVRLGVAARRLERTPHGRLIRDSAGHGHGPKARGLGGGTPVREHGGADRAQADEHAAPQRHRVSTGGPAGTTSRTPPLATRG